MRWNSMAHGLLRSTHKLEPFAMRARLVLVAVLLQYLTATVLLTIAVVAVATQSRLIHPQWTALPQVAYLAVGRSMLLSLLLQGFGKHIFPLLTCAGVLALEVVYRGLWVTAQRSWCARAAHRARSGRGSGGGERRAACLLGLAGTTERIGGRAESVLT